MTGASESVQKHWLLAGMAADHVGPLLACARRVRFLPSEVIFEEGDEADGLYLITAGSVRVTATDEHGKVLLATIGANDVLGEMGLLDGKPRSATATAQGLCTAYFVPDAPFLDALERSAPLCLRLLALLSQRLRAADSRLAEFPDLESPPSEPRSLQ